MAISTHLKQAIDHLVGAQAYTFSGSTVTIASPSMNHTRLVALMEAAAASGHKLSLVSGAIHIDPR